MADFDFPDDLVELERSAWTAIQDGMLTVEQAHAVHEAINKFAANEDLSRLEVEKALKKIVRHPQPEADAA